MRLVEIEKIIGKLIDYKKGVSDINITVGKPFQVEVDGQLESVQISSDFKVLTPFQTEILALNLIDGDRRLTMDLLSKGSCDLAYSLGDKARFRVNIFSQQQTYSIVMRRLPTQIPTIEGLQLPAGFQNMTSEKNGIIFVTGATGSGKSTSLAALLRAINEKQFVHIVTLEDPVEFVHPHIKATFNQRELGKDFDAFSNGLRAAMRQAPKVILVGEMRDRETVEIGLSAAETGHLVLTTLHTIDAGQTINRIIGMFDKDEEAQIRNRLASSIRWVASQRLLSKVGGGRVAAIEVMQNNIRVQSSILYGEQEGKTFYEIIQAGQPYQMQTFDMHILDLYKQGLVTEDTALLFASRRAVLKRGIDQLKSARGEKTSDIEGLAIDMKYEELRDKNQ